MVVNRTHSDRTQGEKLNGRPHTVWVDDDDEPVGNVVPLRPKNTRAADRDAIARIMPDVARLSVWICWNEAPNPDRPWKPLKVPQPAKAVTMDDEHKPLLDLPPSHGVGLITRKAGLVIIDIDTKRNEKTARSCGSPTTPRPARPIPPSPIS